jgi:hypothetical protein
MNTQLARDLRGTQRAEENELADIEPAEVR